MPTPETRTPAVKSSIQSRRESLDLGRDRCGPDPVATASVSRATITSRQWTRARPQSPSDAHAKADRPDNRDDYLERRMPVPRGLKGVDSDEEEQGPKGDENRPVESLVRCSRPFAEDECKTAYDAPNEKDNRIVEWTAEKEQSGGNNEEGGCSAQRKKRGDPPESGPRLSVAQDSLSRPSQIDVLYRLSPPGLSQFPRRTVPGSLGDPPGASTKAGRGI